MSKIIFLDSEETVNQYSHTKFFEHEQLGLRIEFSLLNGKYIGHKIFKNGRLSLLRALDSYDHSFFRECLMCYEDYLKRIGITPYKGGEK